MQNIKLFSIEKSGKSYWVFETNPFSEEKKRTKYSQNTFSDHGWVILNYYSSFIS